MGSRQATNSEIAHVLSRIGDLLEAKGENPFRISRYRRAATVVKDSDRSFARLVQEQGVVGLTRVRGIGEKLAGVIDEYVSTRKVTLLEDLEKDAPSSIQKESNPAKPSSIPDSDARSVPSVELILDVDAEYRTKAEAGSLKRIAPKQHNPEGAACLPHLSTARGRWKFTAMFSNTALAHQSGKTDDWVVPYFSTKGEEEGQCTVLTEGRGALKGKRVIRGRETESQKHYR